MAVENLKSAYITNATATPIVLTKGAIQGGRLRSSTGSITPAADAAVASTYRFCRVPSNSRVEAVLITCAAFALAGAVDIGLYRTSEDGGAVVDANFFASAQALTAAKQNADVTYASGVYTVANSEKLLWEALGLSADPQCEYDVVATVTTQFNGGQAMNLKVHFVA